MGDEVGVMLGVDVLVAVAVAAVVGVAVGRGVSDAPGPGGLRRDEVPAGALVRPEA